MRDGEQGLVPAGDDAGLHDGRRGMAGHSGVVVADCPRHRSAVSSTGAAAHPEEIDEAPPNEAHWLALLLVRVAETTTGRTWPTIRAELQRLHAITYTGAAGTRPDHRTHQDPAGPAHRPRPRRPKRILELRPTTGA